MAMVMLQIYKSKEYSYLPYMSFIRDRKTRSMPMGAMYFKLKIMIFITWTFTSPSLVSWLLMMSRSSSQPAKNAMNIPPAGSRMLDET